VLLEQCANERFGEVARSRVALWNHGKKQKFGFKISAISGSSHGLRLVPCQRVDAILGLESSG
jgi:hypothetical protein